MSVGNLIGLERAKLNLPNSQSTDERTIDALIGACSDAIRKWCRRDFFSRSYDDYNGDGDRRLLLRAYPLISVESVRYRSVTVLKVINNALTTNQQARVTVGRDGLTLLTVASGVRAVNTSITWASYATINAVANAITALGNGWAGQIVGDAGGQFGQGDYGLWPSADLFVPQSYGQELTSQGALTARGQFAELKLHTYELAGYQWDPRGWLLRTIPYTDPELLHPEDLVWPVGINNFRVQYTAGYPTIPEAVQEACAEWAALLFSATQRDSALTVQSAGGVNQRWEKGLGDGEPPLHVQALLAPYRRHSVSTNQG